jgi:uncharacterized protein YecE (DUF72 family)
VRVRVGTSGFSYGAWRGSFYPEGMKPAGFLAFYARQFATVEINNTFYRMPKPELLERWAAETPAEFSFVLKAPQRITHVKRLSDADSLAFFLTAAAVLGERVGPLLFQLPPFFRKDAARLREFLALVPEGRKAAFEFRHASWFDDEVYAALRERGAALCSADTDESGEQGAPVVPTADWGYLRLRRSGYDEPAIAAWAERIRSQPWSEAWVFFKHEEQGVGPALAKRLIAALGG